MQNLLPVRWKDWRWAAVWNWLWPVIIGSVLTIRKSSLACPKCRLACSPVAVEHSALPRLAGLQAAGMAIMMGQPMNPQAALAQNVVNEVVPAGTTIEKAKEWVKANPKAAAPWDKKGFKFPGGAGSMDPRAVPLYMGSSAMALKQSKGNYEAVKAILSCLYEGSMLPMDTALRVESKYFTKLLSLAHKPRT